jgi:hypothetical protein
MLSELMAMIEFGEQMVLLELLQVIAMIKVFAHQFH